MKKTIQSMQSDLKIKGAETTRDSVIQQQFDESKMKVVKETAKARLILYEKYGNVFKVWVPKDCRNISLFISKKVDEIYRMYDFVVQKETDMAACVEFHGYNIWVPKSIWLNYPKRENKVISWILENKFNKIGSIQYETEKAILTDGVWVPKVCLIELNDIRYVPIWKLEKKGGSNE